VDFTRAARIYWLSVYPSLRGELGRWREQAEAIPDPVLRRIALKAQRAKLGNIEGAVAFAVLAGPSTRFAAMQAMACYETTLDYLDCLCEMPARDPVANGRRLNQALIAAVEPGARHIDYYAFHSRNADNGYLRKLVDACRDAFGLLPSRAIVGEAMRRASSRIATYQSLNHGDENGSYRPFERWAKRETALLRSSYPTEEMCWWEIAASAGSSLVVFALIAAAADEGTARGDAFAIERAYFPWIGAVNSLLDSLIDQSEDNEPGQHRLLDYYASSDETASRLATLVVKASHRAQQLEARHMHSLILAAMVSFYLSAPEAQVAEMHALRESIRKAMGDLDRPTMLIMKARRAASKAAAIGKANTRAAT
jgi:tetraprenyl-beta-curcumene synthase